MRHLLASASLRDGRGLFTLAWSLVVIPWSLATIFNYRGMAERYLGAGHHLINQQVAHVFAVTFVAAGLLDRSLAIHRFAQCGYRRAESILTDADPLHRDRDAVPHWYKYRPEGSRICLS